MNDVQVIRARFYGKKYRVRSQGKVSSAPERKAEVDNLLMSFMVGWTITCFAVLFTGCATTPVPSASVATVEMVKIPVPSTATAPAASIDETDVGPRLLATNVKFGQVEREDDCGLPEDSVERHITYILDRAGVPRPDNILVKMLRQSSLCEDPKIDDGFIHLAEVGVTLRWLSITSEQFAQAKTLLKDMQLVSSILP